MQQGPLRNDEATREAWRQIGPCLEAQGYELVEVEFGQSSGRPVLRLFVDKEGGMALDDCVWVSQALGPVLDRCDLLEGSYVLEVSSPGLDRPIRKPADFLRFVGERVKLRCITPVQGRRQFTGVLQKFEDGLIVLDCAGTPCEIHIENLARARLDR